MLVLFLLKQKSMYTYEMMSTVEKISGGELIFNTLYLAIYRLQSFNYIEEKPEDHVGGQQAQDLLRHNRFGQGISRRSGGKLPRDDRRDRQNSFS